MSNKFSEALEVILHHEGGYVNHPKDPGGETNLMSLKEFTKILVAKKK